MDWASIIGNLLLPALLRCLTKTSSEDPQQILRESYDAATGKMDSDLVREAMPTTRQAARRAYRQASRSDKKSFQPLSEQQVYDLTEKKLIEAMNASQEDATVIRAAASALADNDQANNQE